MLENHGGPSDDSYDDIYIDDVHTTLRVGGGAIEYGKAPTFKAVINPSSSRPARSDLRCNISMKLLGRLERLAKSRFIISKISKIDPANWHGVSPLIIAQSVNASSEIEGEHIRAESLEVIFTDSEAAIQAAQPPDYAQRIKAVTSITDAYFYALLEADFRQAVSIEFIKDLHYRMFSSTRPEIAGKFKTQDVVIRGAGYEVITLPPNKVEEYLKELCDRTNRFMNEAETHSEASKFISTALFIIDFLAIHPFSDGNGRLARLLSTYLLERSGYHFAQLYPLDTIILESKSDYYQALFEAQKNWYKPNEDLTRWINYYTLTVFLQWNRAYHKVRENKGQKFSAMAPVQSQEQKTFSNAELAYSSESDVVSLPETTGAHSTDVQSAEFDD